MLNKRPFKIEKAPGKELIPVIIDTKSLEALKEFYNLRVNWNDNYPLVHDGLTSYGIFADLDIAIIREKAFSPVYIDQAIDIAKSETDRLYLNAIFLLSGFCSKGKKEFMPTQSQIEALPELRERAMKFSFYSNMDCFWRQVLDYFSKDESFNREEYAVQYTDYKKMMDLDFPAIDADTICPLSLEEMDSAFFRTILDKERYLQCQFVKSAQIENDKYWVGLYKALAENLKNKYVFIKQNENGKTEVKEKLVDVRTEPDLKLELLKFHYSA